MKKIVKYASGIFAIGAALALGIGMSQISPAAQEPDPIPETALSQGELGGCAEEGDICSAPSAEPESCITAVSVYVPPCSVDQLLEESTLVVRGRVTGILEPFFIRNAEKTGTQVWTDYELEVEEAARGEAPDRAITVRMQGDPTDHSVVYLDDPVLENGKEYLLFLQKPATGGGFNTAGDYYYIRGFRQGVYEPVSLSLGEKQGEFFVSQKHLLKWDNQAGGALQAVHKKAEDISLADMEAGEDALEWGAFLERAAAINEAAPVDEGLVRKTIVENLTGSMENGFLSEEEMEAALAELDQYGEIVE